MSGETRKKVDLDLVIEQLISELKEIDSNDALSRSEKTKLITRAATKVKSRLHDDKRKKDGSRITLSTYRRYMTDVRRAVTEMNWKHHSLAQQIERLSKRYPAYADQLQAIGSMDNITDLRIAHRDFLKTIKSDVDAYEDIKPMKLDHEVMRHLTLPSAHKEELARQAEEALEEKKTTVVELDYHEIMSGLVDLLTRKTKTVGSESTYSFSRLALGVGLATGRRSVEILKQGEFKKVSANQLEFSGQAKKRGGADYDESYTIYTLVDADIVMQALQSLRHLPEIVALDEYDKLGEVRRNDAINKRCAKTLNTTTKQFFNDDSRVFKDSRAIWARLVFDLHYKAERKAKKIDEDIFWRNMLGHDDIETQRSYKHFAVDYDNEPEPEEKPSKFASRAEALAALDNHENITRRKAVSKIHDWVKGRIAEDPEALITQSLLIREVGSGRKVIKDYLDLAEPALAITNAPASIAVAEVPADRIQAPEPEQKAGEPEQNDQKAEQEPEKPVQKAAKPNIKGKKMPDGSWHAEVHINGTVVAVASSPDSNWDAQKLAWRRYQDDNATSTTRKDGDFWRVQIKTLGDLLVDLEQKGSKKSAEEAAWSMFRNRD